jgi:hypothetical protein
VAVEVADFGDKEEEEAAEGKGGREGGREGEGGGLVRRAADKVADAQSESIVVGAIDKELPEGHGRLGKDVDEKGLEFALREGGGEGGREGGQGGLGREGLGR